MTGELRILSVAPRYRPGTDGAQGGHYTIYQDDLRAAAQRLDIPMTVVADRGVPPSDGMVAVLDTTDERSIAASVATVVRPDDVLMVYEGSRAMVEAFASIAVAYPSTTFVVNLFRPEPGLVPAEDARTRKQPLRPSTERHLPPNLVVTAETELRAELARRIGIPCVGAWRLHTTLWDTTVDAPERSSAEDGLRVLVPLADRGYSEETVRDIAYVLHRLRRHPARPAVRLTLTGGGSARFAARVRGPRLEALGARRVVASPSREEYAALFAENDVVWIPNRRLYRSQSSGKTLDALAVGRPVIAWAGTWPATESARWVGEELAYEDPEEMVRLLIDLAGRRILLQERLAGLSAEIRAAYAPEATLLRVLGLVADRSCWSPADWLPAMPIRPESVPGLASHRRPDDIRDRRGLGALQARLAARRASLIGPRERIGRRARRRFAGFRSALRRALRGARSG